MFQVCTAFLASEQKFSPQLNNIGGLDLSTRRATDTGTHTHTHIPDQSKFHRARESHRKETKSETGKSYEHRRDNGELGQSAAIL